MTQKEIARRLGLSRITVQRVLSGSKSAYVVAPATRERILRFAREVGYRPDRSARKLVRNETYKIALFSTSAPEFIWEDVSKGVELAKNQVSDFGYDVSYYRIPTHNSDAYLQTLSDVLEEGVDAVAVVNNIEFPMREIFALIEAKRVPYITFNIDADDSKRLCFIGPDYRLEGRLAAEFLWKSAGPESRLIAITVPVDADGIPVEGADIDNERLRGFHDAIRERDTTKTGPNDVLLNTKESVEQQLRAALEGGPNGLFWASPDTDVVRRLRDEGVLNRTKMVTSNLSEPLRELVQDGTIDAILYHNPIVQGYYAVMVLERYLETRIVPERTRYLVSHSVLMQENIEFYSQNYLLLDSFYGIEMQDGKTHEGSEYQS